MKGFLFSFESGESRDPQIVLYGYKNSTIFFSKSEMCFRVFFITFTDSKTIQEIKFIRMEILLLSYLVYIYIYRNIGNLTRGDPVLLTTLKLY